MISNFCYLYPFPFKDLAASNLHIVSNIGNRTLQRAIFFVFLVYIFSIKFIINKLHLTRSQGLNKMLKPIGAVGILMNKIRGVSVNIKCISI